MDAAKEYQKLVKLPLNRKIFAFSVFFGAITASFFDEMGVLKHVWLATLAALLVHYVYSNFLLPQLLTSFPSMKGSRRRVNCFVVVTMYVLSSCSGAGLITALLNTIGLSAVYQIVAPSIPVLLLPGLMSMASVVLMLLAAFRLMHYLVAVPLAVASAISAFFAFKSRKTQPESDIESLIAPVKLSTQVLKAFLAFLISFFVFIILFYWILLSINPFWMRADRISKFETLNRLPHDQNLRVREVSSLADLEFLKSKLKDFPMVIKPSICTTNSRNVVKCDTYACLQSYLTRQLQDFPEGGAWVIQEYAKGLEGVVFYYKFPYSRAGAIKNIGIRATARQSRSDKGTKLTSKYWPSQFRTDFSAEYVKFFDDMAARVPGYNGGRFDVILPGYQLKDPRGLQILELNVFFLGCIQEKSITSAWDELKRLRTSIFQIYVGIVNIVGGYNYLSAVGIAIKVPRLIERAVLCGNYEHLIAKP